MAQVEPLSFSQPDNELSKIAAAERAKLFPKNDYNTGNQYSSVNPNALADGDEKGRGTGNFLDVYNQNIGTRTDVIERKNEIKVNEYQVNKPYTTPPA
jgi:hypothetical protein